jgi:damage-control phosphatase, subfamily I
MTTSSACLPCFVRQAVEAVGFCVPDEDRRVPILRRLLADLSTADWHTSPVAVAQQLHRRIRQATGDADPYHALKDGMNRLALEMLPGMFQDARFDENPRMAIVRLAVAGNLIDSGAKTGMTETNVREALCRANREPLYGPAIALFEAAEHAQRILFLADNAGEIVFDRALIEILPSKKITVAVRGSPVLNDATMEDAQVAGLTGLTPIITNGSDAPGTILEDCSAEFRRVYEDSDLIIAKGQGNYESLAATTKHIFFLLRVKCPLVAAQVGAKAGDMIVLERNVEGAP